MRIQTASLLAQPVKNLSAIQETRVQSLGQEDSPGEGNGYLLQYSCLENPMDRGVWQATVHGITRVGHSLVTKPPLFIKETAFSSLSALHSLVKCQLTIYTRGYCGLLILLHWSIHLLLCQCHTISTSAYSLKSQRLMAPALFFLRISLAIQDPLWFHINFWNIFLL